MIVRGNNNTYMSLKKYIIPDCVEGDILASDVVNAYGVILAARETILNEYIINKLIANGIHSVKVHEIPSNMILNKKFMTNYQSAVTQTKHLFNDLLSGNRISYHDLLTISNNIRSITGYEDEILKILNKLRKSDEYTYYHSVNVAYYSYLIAKSMKLNDSQIEKAILSGILHDLGKMKIPIVILNKKGKLTDEEFEVIKEHTILGFQLIDHIDEIDNDIKMAVLLHHERMDGSGYPFHYKSDNDLNLYSKIVAIADVYDAMTSDRVYRKKTTPFEVFEMFQTVGVSLFDFEIMKNFIQKLAVYLVGTKALLSNGEQGEIVYIPYHNVTSPVVKVPSGYIELSNYSDLKILNINI